MRFAPLANFLGLHWSKNSECLGNPAISVPTGEYTVDNIPLSVQFMGRHWEEHTLLRLANLVEKNVSTRKRPRVWFPTLK